MANTGSNSRSPKSKLTGLGENNTVENNVAEVDSAASAVEKLQKENSEIKEQLNQMTSLLASFQKMLENNSKEVIVQQESPKVEKKPERVVDLEVPEEPSPNKMVRITSLCRGSLNLSEDDSGSGKVRFTKYGETKTILYSSLINIVNHNRSFAEKGAFYILDNSAVYYLGLKDVYTNLLTQGVLDNICQYEDVDIVSIIENTEPFQIETMVKNLADRLYSGEKLDLNKIELISKKSGLDIMAKVNEMKEFGDVG